MLYQGIIGGGSSPVEPEDLSPVLLWTNPSPTSEFASERKVELNLTDYTGVIIEFRYTNEDDFVCNRTYVKKVDILNKKLTDNSNVYFGGGCGYRNPSGSWASRGRIISSVDDTGVTFGSGGYANSAADSFLIPIRIYGVKEYVVDSNLGGEIETLAFENYHASNYKAQGSKLSTITKNGKLIIIVEYYTINTDITPVTTISVNGINQTLTPTTNKKSSYNKIFTCELYELNVEKNDNVNVSVNGVEDNSQAMLYIGLV